MGGAVSVYTLPMMTKYRTWLGVFILALGLLSLAGCTGTRRPVLYPNAHLQSVGEARAHADVDQCMRLAETHGAPVYGGKDVARDTATGAAVAGAAAGAWGLVRKNGEAGNRALAGAAAGSTAGLVRGILRVGRPSQTLVGFVNRCLSERGYEVVGWR